MMNKDYLPFYNGLEEKYKQFWLKCTKEELIDHFIGSIYNGESLLKRITTALEYIEQFEYYIPEDNIPELKKILTGSIRKEEN